MMNTMAGQNAAECGSCVFGLRSFAEACPVLALRLQQTMRPVGPAPARG